MPQELTSDAPTEHPELGKWVTRCGPKGKASTFGLVILFGFMASGLVCMIAGLVVTPKPGSESAPAVFIGLGIAIVLIGILCLVIMLLLRYPQVDLYTGGVRFKSKAVEEMVPWERIEGVLITTIYDTRFSSYRTVAISIAGKDDLSFESKLEGEPDRVIDSIAQNAPNVETKEIDLGA